MSSACQVMLLNPPGRCFQGLSGTESNMTLSEFEALDTCYSDSATPAPTTPAPTTPAPTTPDFVVTVFQISAEFVGLTVEHFNTNSSIPSDFKTNFGGYARNIEVILTDSSTIDLCFGYAQLADPTPAQSLQQIIDFFVTVLQPNAMSVSWLIPPFTAVLCREMMNASSMHMQLPGTSAMISVC